MSHPWYWYFSNEAIEKGITSLFDWTTGYRKASGDDVFNPNTRYYDPGINAYSIAHSSNDSYKNGVDFGNRIKQYTDAMYNAGYDVLTDPQFANTIFGKAFIGDKPDSDSKTLVPDSNSASGVRAGSVPVQGDLSYLTYLANLRHINEANNAFNVEQARQQMAFQREMNTINMNFNAEEAEKARNWQQYMSNTAHQREQADLRAAGLNPILAVSGGNGASIGSGAAASASGGPSGSRATADNVYASAMLSVLDSAMNIAEKSATSAVTANAVASGKSSSTGLNLQNVVKGIGSIVDLVYKIKKIF